MRAGARLGLRLTVAVAFGGTAALAVIVSSGAQSGTALAPVSSSSSAQPVLTTGCTSSGLRMFVGPGDPVSAALTRYAVDFTNVSRAPCTLGGYPEVAAYRGDGEQVGAAAARDTSVAASPVVLAPGQTAHASLDAARPQPRCRPVTAAGLRVVVLPGQPALRYLRPLTACTAVGAPGTGHGYLRIRAIQAGKGTA
jgi:Protein of unknown function (DUF4232)